MILYLPTYLVRPERVYTELVRPTTRAQAAGSPSNAGMRILATVIVLSRLITCGKLFYYLPYFKVACLRLFLGYSLFSF